MKETRQFLSNCWWFDDNAEEGVAFYRSVFPESTVFHTVRYGKEGFEIHKRPEGSVMAIAFSLNGSEFQIINGGPVFRINPSVSYFIMCEDAAEADRYWNALSPGGKVLMEIDTYDWSPRYGWLQDRFGVSWQVYTGDGQTDAVGQKICPSFMFSGKQHGRAEEAVNFYTSVFDDSSIDGFMRYPAGGKDPEGTIMHSQFRLNGHVFMAMDSAEEHDFEFNEGASVVVNCKTQEEIDRYWNALLADGGKEFDCGWLKDKFGLSWQVVPVQLEEMMNDPDVEKRERVTKAFLAMNKLDIAGLERAYSGK